MEYGLWNGKTFTKASEIIAMLDANVPLQNAHIQAVRELCKHGCRYSNEHSDVLSAALHAVGKTEIATWNRAWVERMNREAA